jgi:hypothetical protein
MRWSVHDYQEELKKLGARPTGLQENVEASLLKMFPPDGDSGILSTPTVIVDSKGVILLWYLPGLLGPRRRVNVLSSIVADNR